MGGAEDDGVHCLSLHDHIIIISIMEPQKEPEPKERLEYVRNFSMYYGYSPSRFVPDTLQFFKLSTDRQYVHNMIDLLIKYHKKNNKRLKFDDSSPEGRKALYRQLARWCFPDDKYASKGYQDKWGSGENDFTSDTLETAFYGKTEPPLPAPSWIELRYAVARTITYLRVLPPDEISNANARKRFDNDCIDSIMTCWNFIKQHRHCVKAKRILINQHCLDEIYYMFPDNSNIVLQPGNVGKFAAMQWNKDPRGKSWHREWTIFRAITNEPTGYPSHCKVIWHPSMAPIWKP